MILKKRTQTKIGGIGGVFLTSQGHDYTDKRFGTIYVN